MSGNQNYDLSTHSGSASPLADGLSSGQSVDLAASGLEEHGDDPSAVTDAARPSLGVKLTAYRLLVMASTFIFCITSGILNYKGQSTAATTVDWVSGGVVAVVLYWIGLYEQEGAYQWFFQVDLAPAISYCTKRFIGGVGAPFFFFEGPSVFCGWLSWVLNMLAGYRTGHYSGRVSFSLFAVAFFQCIVISTFLCFLWYCAHILNQRVLARVWAWKRAMRFLDDYSPGAPLEYRYWWFGVMGMVVGIFCGIVLVVSPLIVLVLYHFIQFGRPRDV